MECDCAIKNVRRHKVIRHYLVAGIYERCGACGRVEWLDITDALEIELKEANYKCIKAKAVA